MKSKSNDTSNHEAFLAMPHEDQERSYYHMMHKVISNSHYGTEYHAKLEFYVPTEAIQHGK